MRRGRGEGESREKERSIVKRKEEGRKGGEAVKERVLFKRKKNMNWKGRARENLRA